MSTSAVVGGRIQEESGHTEMLGGFDDASYDEKGRLLLSVTQRAALKNGFTLGISEYGCLQICPTSNWKKIEEGISRYSDFNFYKSRFQLLVVGRAARNLNLDAGERIQIPSHYRDKFKLPKKVKVVGNDNRYLILTPEEFADFDSDPVGFRQEEATRFQEVQRLLMQEEARIASGGTS